MCSQASSTRALARVALDPDAPPHAVLHAIDVLEQLRQRASVKSARDLLPSHRRLAQARRRAVRRVEE